MDLLVKLYALPPGPDPLPPGITLRRALAPEAPLILPWIAARFGEGWRAEAAVALSACPTHIHIAHDDAGTLLGFACHDVTARGLFGPTGVDEGARGTGLGKALLLASLRAMAADGYAYAVIGGAGPVEFYQKAVDAIPIAGSEPGLYRGMLRAPV
ncbi:GNAT family acetyltransferase [alpha proteobacterium AAP38]|uniref:GNAT family N-acetyltransferase n=1 Tax=Niveispirillum sp. TaxID=1917217 RepID=UPI0006B9D5F0|nr:GNAT family acetyltransferase [alpha proteobacterium AAP38]